MAAITTVVDTFYRVSDALLDLDDQFVRWPERAMVNYFNDAVRALAKWVPPACARMDVIKLVPGTRQSIADIPAARIIRGDGLPASRTFGTMMFRLIRNMGRDGATPGRAINVAAIGTLDRGQADWHTSTATIVEDVIYDERNPTYFFVSPGVPAASNVYVEISYQAQPDVLVLTTPGQFGQHSTDTTVIPVPDLFLDEIINYMLARAYLKDSSTAGNAQLAQSYSEIFVASINSLAQQYTGTNPNLTRLPFAPQPAAASS